MPTFKCPNCGEEIETLETVESVTDYGHCRLRMAGRAVDTYDYEHDDYGDSYGDAEYRCPECGDELDVGDVVVSDGEGEEGTAEEAGPEAGIFMRADGRDPLADFGFCSECRDLKRKDELNSGKCETCRDE